MRGEYSFSSYPALVRGNRQRRAGVGVADFFLSTIVFKKNRCTNPHPDYPHLPRFQFPQPSKSIFSKITYNLKVLIFSEPEIGSTLASTKRVEKWRFKISYNLIVSSIFNTACSAWSVSGCLFNKSERTLQRIL